MESLEGRLSRDELGGAGVWKLALADGRTVQLMGAIEPALDGAEVQARVRRIENAMGFGMVGPMYEVLEVHRR